MKIQKRELSIDERCELLNKKYNLNCKKTAIHGIDQFEREITQDADMLGISKYHE